MQIKRISLLHRCSVCLNMRSMHFQLEILVRKSSRAKYLIEYSAISCSASLIGTLHQLKVSAPLPIGFVKFFMFLACLLRDYIFMTGKYRVDTFNIFSGTIYFWMITYQQWFSTLWSGCLYY